MPKTAPALIVIGASVRGFAASAARAGRLVYAVDLFDDLDLAEVAAGTLRIRDLPGGYPAGLPAAVRGLPRGDFCYTGAMENHPQVIAAIARERRLLGSPPEAVAVVRDPFAFGDLVRSAGLAYPRCHARPTRLPQDGSFLRKPRAGAGGRGIVRWDAAAPPTVEASVYQRHVSGTPWSAALLLTADGVRLYGASRQLVGESWCHARGFHYCGSIDMPPDELPASRRAGLLALARGLARTGLRGLVGVDYVVDAAGTAWVLEVNPRPTASLELVERATGRPCAADHLAACGGAAAGRAGLRAGGGHHAKAVLFAPREIGIDTDAVARLLRWRRSWAVAGAAGLADIPRAGQTVAAGSPLCTVFAFAASATEAVARLRRRAATVFAGLRPPVAAAGRPTGPRGSTP